MDRSDAGTPVVVREPTSRERDFCHGVEHAATVYGHADEPAICNVCPDRMEAHRAHRC